MEYILTLMDVDLIIDFVIYGIILNFVSSLLTIVITMVRASSFTEDDRKLFVNFSMAKRAYRVKNPAGFKILFSSMTMLLPIYVVYINCIFVYNVLKHPGARGFINGAVESEKF